MKIFEYGTNSRSGHSADGFYSREADKNRSVYMAVPYMERTSRYTFLIIMLSEGV